MITINNFNNNQHLDFNNNVSQLEIKDAKARMGNYQAQANLQGMQELRNQEFKQIQSYQNNQGSLNNNVNFQRLNEQLLIADKLNNGVNNEQNARLYSNLLNSNQQFKNFNTLF